MRQLFGLAILTKKELMQLLVEEERFSYRKGYKAGAAMRYRHEKKPLVTTDGIPLTPVYSSDFTPPPAGMQFDYTPEGNLRVSGIDIVVNNPPEVSAQVMDENAMPTVYGDSLPIKPMPEVVVHTEENANG